MNWHDYIYSDPLILAGKPVVRGTRLAVDFLLDLFAAGWPHQQVLDSYPQLSDEALRAVFAFAAEAMQDESKYAVRLAAADALSGGRELASSRSSPPACSRVRAGPVAVTSV